MDVEIILACRGETPDNLRHTTNYVRDAMRDGDKLTIVLDGPHDHVAYNIEGCEVVQLFDSPHGCGRLRDWAMSRPGHPIVAMVDGHMTFEEGWLDAIRGHLSVPRNARDVTCCHLQGLDHYWSPIQREAIYDGCHLETLVNESGRRSWWLNAVWNTERLQRGPVGAIMGACYGVRRAWYAKMGRPLAILDAWGADEEIISACSWLMGGRCYLLPVTCGHLWASPRLWKEGPDLHWTERYRMLANHYAMLAALPLPDDERARTLEWLNGATVHTERIESALEARADAIARIKLALAGAKRTWADLRADGIVRDWVPRKQEADTTARPSAKACEHQFRMAARPGERVRCRRCGAFKEEA